MKIPSLMLVPFLVCFEMAAQNQPMAAPLVSATSFSVSNLDPAAFQPVSRFRESASGLIARPESGLTTYKWSMAALIAANSADAISSWRQLEANHVVGAGPRATFGYSSLAIKSSFAGTSLLIQHVVLRHRPDLYKKLAWLNFASAGGLGAVAFHNVSIR
jgi:hypothetical protein